MSGIDLTINHDEAEREADINLSEKGVFEVEIKGASTTNNEGEEIISSTGRKAIRWNFAVVNHDRLNGKMISDTSYGPCEDDDHDKAKMMEHMLIRPATATGRSWEGTFEPEEFISETLKIRTDDETYVNKDGDEVTRLKVKSYMKIK